MSGRLAATSFNWALTHKPLHSLAVQELPPGFRLLLVAQRTDDVPGVALLTELIRPDELSAVRDEQCLPVYPMRQGQSGGGGTSTSCV